MIRKIANALYEFHKSRKSNHQSSPHLRYAATAATPFPSPTGNNARPRILIFAQLEFEDWKFSSRFRKPEFWPARKLFPRFWITGNHSKTRETVIRSGIHTYRSCVRIEWNKCFIYKWNEREFFLREVEWTWQNPTAEDGSRMGENCGRTKKGMKGFSCSVPSK